MKSQIFLYNISQFSFCCCLRFLIYRTTTITFKIDVFFYIALHTNVVKLILLKHSSLTKSFSDTNIFDKDRALEHFVHDFKPSRALIQLTLYLQLFLNRPLLLIKVTYLILSYEFPILCLSYKMFPSGIHILLNCHLCEFLVSFSLRSLTSTGAFFYSLVHISITQYVPVILKSYYLISYVSYLALYLWIFPQFPKSCRSDRVCRNTDVPKLYLLNHLLSKTTG